MCKNQVSISIWKELFKKIKQNISISSGLMTTFAVCLLVFCIFQQSVQAETESITATLSSNSITTGDQTVLTVNISGSQSAQPHIEEIKGLNFIAAGQSMQYRNINGRASSSVSYRYVIQGITPGNYTIAPIKANINGKILKTKPLKLYISNINSQLTQSVTNLNQTQRGVSQNANNRQSLKQRKNTDRNEIAFLRVFTSRKNFYIGEQVPIVIKAYFKEGIQASINSLPIFKSSAFAFHGMETEPLQETRIIDGQRYIVLTWESAMSGIKEGEYPVSAMLSATLLIRDNRSRRLSSSFGRSMFDDAFFGNFFGQVREKKIELNSPEQKVAVLPLPKLNRPKDFTGAVGQFKLSAKATPTHLATGDPITLTITVSGKGNFDRVSAPKLCDIKGWKIYSPGSEFKPKGGSGYIGRKIFEQAIIPESAKMDKIPSITFSYFDTQKKKYKTLRTKAIPITVKESAQQSYSGTNTVQNSLKADDDSAVKKNIQQNIDPDTGLAPVRLKLGHNITNLTPYFKQPWFITINAASTFFLFGGFFLIIRKRKKIENPQTMEKRKTNQKINLASKQMEQAIYECNSMDFFNAARQAIQERLTNIWHIPPEAITLGDIKEKLSEDNNIIYKTFEMADAVTYSGLTINQDELRDYKKALLKELNNSKLFKK